ncbi:MAG TPA: FG-GAP-like repeat-containing protein [Vicinamibacterales bacterium]|nr:FG-GAP-like repeat-containing protein [Vicinamibacterales bacterium]
MASSFAAAAVARAQPLSFARDDVASATGARGIAVADLNRDGWPDVATANTVRNSVVVLLNHAGTLTKSLEVPVGRGPFDITSGDFNGDGKPDLAVTNADANSVTLLVGDGSGGFSAQATIPFGPSVSSPRGIRAADVNGDGRLDLVVTGYSSNSVMTLIGDGAGGFSIGPSFTGYAPQPQGAAVADFNHDGRPDLAVAYDSGGGLAIMYGNGTANLFAAPKAVGGPQSLNVVAAADFNGDGWMDVAAASTRNGIVSVFLGSSTGLAFSGSYSVGSSPRGIAVADVNDDGALDIVTANYGAGTVSVVIGNKARPGLFTGEVQFAAGPGSRAVAIADMNHDARIDIVAADQNAAAATVLVNEMAAAPAAFAFRATTIGTDSGTAGGSNHVEVADFNRDGKPDLATLGANLDVLVYLGGGGTVSLQPNPPYGVGRWNVVDANADGAPDIVSVLGAEPDTLTAFVGNGRGTFTKVQTSTPLRVADYALADMNGDGRPDLVFYGYDRGAATYVLGVFQTNANGTFTLVTKMPIGTQLLNLAVADVDRDGKSDVVAEVWPTGLTTFTDYAASQGWRRVATYDLSLPNIAAEIVCGDVNHDGFADLVLSTDEQTAVMLGGASGFREATYFDRQTVGGSFWSPTIADVNVDGNPDVVTDQGVIVFGNGDGTFGPPQKFDVGINGGYGVTAADVDGDGLPDLLFGGAWSQVTVLYNSRDTANHPPSVSGGDRTVSYQDQFGEDGVVLVASGSDPDAHALTYVWRDQHGAVVATSRFYELLQPLPPGTYTFTVTASDGRGASATDSVALTIAPVKEIVVWAADGFPQGSAWVMAADASAAGGARAYNPNANAAKINAPLANPSSGYTIGFIADPTQTYKLWIRLKADGNSPYNDSIFVQFSGSTDAAGHPAYRQGTTSALPINLEECAGCGESGWGWEDDGWGSVDRNGVTLRFPDGGFHQIFIQQREDGVSIDQIVLSSEKFLTTRPGKAKNDSTILPRTFVPGED